MSMFLLGFSLGAICALLAMIAVYRSAVNEKIAEIEDSFEIGAHPDALTPNYMLDKLPTCLIEAEMKAIANAQARLVKAFDERRKLLEIRKANRCR